MTGPARRRSIHSPRTAMVATGACLAVAALVAIPLDGLAAPITISGSMEGNLPVNSGDTLQAGYHFQYAGGRPASSVDVTGVTVTLPVNCPDGTSVTLTIPIKDASFSVPANNDDEFPAGGQSSPAVWQGSITVPSICKGSTGHAPKGATFTADFTSSDTQDPVHIQFHYADATSGSWSATAALTPSTPSTPPSTPSTPPPSQPTTTTPTPTPTNSVQGVTSPSTPTTTVATSTPNTGAGADVRRGGALLLGGAGLVLTALLSLRRHRRS